MLVNTLSPDNRLKVFLCHAHADQAAVRVLYKRLIKDGVDAWLDKEKLSAGANWEYEIRKAVRESNVVIICLSKGFSDSGFRQEEVQIALDEARMKSKEEIFIIPVRLEECDVPKQLATWHWVDYYTRGGYSGLIKSLNSRASQLQPATVEISKADETNSHDGEFGKTEATEKISVTIGGNVQGPLIIGDGNKLKTLSVGQAPKKDAKPNPPIKNAEEGTPKKRKLKMGYIVGLISAAATLVGALIGILPQLVNKHPTPSDKIPTSIATSTNPVIIPPTPLPAEMTDAKGIIMRLIEGGDFVMGSDNGDPDEKPAHSVYLKTFFIDKYEVTNSHYKACVDANGCKPPANTSSSATSNYFGNNYYGDYPVIYVSWEMAKTYCEWRGARLPTEAEWEKAARGTDGRTYPWGNDISRAFANYNSNIGGTSIVGSYKGPSPYGVYDMAGNVWEWVADWYDAGYYAKLGDEFPSPAGPETGQYRILRGGSWSDNAAILRVSNRLKSTPDVINADIGFRCASSVP